MALQVVTGRDFAQEVLSHAGRVVVDFTADWCMPCRILTPRLERFAAEHAAEAKFVKLDVDVDEATSERYDVRTIPTLIAFQDGREVKRVINPQSSSALESLLE